MIMKTLYTIYTNFAKCVFFLLFTLLISGGSALGATWKWTASNVNELGSNTSNAITLNGKEWTTNRSSGTNQSQLQSGCIQIGANGAAQTITLKSSAFTGKILSVAVECASYNSYHSVSISVGGTSYLSATPTPKWTTVDSKEGTGESSGEIQISFTKNNSSARALYLKSITIEYDESSVEDDEPVYSCGWIATDINNISSTDLVVITMTNSIGTTYAMSNDKGTSAAPSAIPVTVLKNTLDGDIDDKIKWNVSNNDGTLTIYPNGTTTTWLYCTDTNNGTRVGTNTNKTFEIDANSGYLVHEGTSRYIGVYNSQDWRCYTSVNNNIKDQTLKFYKYVKCGPTETTITFDSNGGVGGPSPVTATKDEEMPSIASSLPSRTGHTLKGYYDAESGGTKYYNADGTSAKDWDKDDAEYTLYAQWTANKHSLTWNLNGGKVTIAGTNAAVDATGTVTGNVAYGATIKAPVVIKTGYTFAGWHDGNTIVTPPNTMPDNNLSYTAQWTANTYTVQFDANGGTGTMSNQPFTYDVAQNLSENTYTRTGYNFTGWNTAADGTGTTYADKAEVQNLTSEPNGEITLYAQWEEKKLTNFRTLCEYTVTWELAGGQIDGNTDDIVDTYTNGQEIQKPADPTREGHRFLGWSPAFVEGTKMQSQSLIYTAQWFELVVTQLQWSEDYYTATMEADNDFPDLTIQPNDFAGTLTYQSSIPDVATIDADGTITLIGIGTTTITASIAADDTYLAASDSYQLTVVESNCKWVEVTNNTTLEDGDEVVIAMEYNGFLYALPNDGGDKTPVLVTVTEADILSDGVSENLIWDVEKETTDLIFHPNNSTDNLFFNREDDGVRIGSTQLNAKVNHQFVIINNHLANIKTSRYLGIGTVNGEQKWKTYTTTTGNLEKQTLKFYKRVCLDSEHYWLTWDATDGQFADGSKQIVKDYEVGTTINKPFDPTRTGYDFAGWSTDGVNVVTPAEKMPEENLSYSAVWQIKSYTVTWDADGGQFANGETVIEETYEYGATIIKPADPTRTGYTFKGWSPNVPDKMSTDNLKFVAQWQVNQYTVTWNPGDGGHWGDSFAPIVENYNYGDPINKPANPEKAGYVFDKWEPDVVATMPNNNLTYTAKWNTAFCDAFTFHTGDADVWNKPQEQICFEFKANHEWQIINYVIPTSDAQSHFLVADRGWPQKDQGYLGGHSKSVTSTWSATMYLAPSMDSNDGNGSPKVGHAKGAVGTLRIFDDSNWDNLYVGFIPNGYKLKFGANEYDFEHYEDAEYRSEIVEYNSTTANNNVSVGIINTSTAYVKTDHTQEGMRHIFLKVNDNWKQKGAKFAIYYWDNNGNGWSKFMKSVPGETDLYEGWIPTTYINFKFVRLNSSAANPNWDSKWNETSDLTLQTGKTLYSIPSDSWDNANNNNWSTYKRHGKFRIYNNSWDKNWYVHFYPHYVITFDKNAEDATGTMPPQALPLDANPKTIVLNACGFERRGYDFTGWKTDVAITADGANVAANGDVKDKATISNINKDITLKAQWKAQAYTINYRDQGDIAYSGENLASLPTTHTYDQTTTLVAGVKTGYTFGGWYTTPECDGTAITELGAQDYTADITLYAKWTFAMEYNITNTETIFITSAKGQTVKAATQIMLQVNNMPDGTTIGLSAANIKFYFGNEEIKQLTNKYVSETFPLTIAYAPDVANTTEQPAITLSVMGNEKTFEGLISARSLPETFAVVAKVGNMWYALPSQGLNSTDDLMGYPVEVDNQDDPTVVTKVPANADWSLRQVYAGQNANATKDRFKQYGANLVFVNSDVKALNASQSNYVLTDALYSNYYDKYPGRYEWTPTTTDLETYQLTNVERDRKLSIDILTRFGIYKGEIENMRFLRIKERYIPASLQVVEWKENSIVIMYTGDPAQTATLAIDGTTAIGSAILNKVNKDVAIYELPASGLMNYATKRLLITIGNGQKWLTVPYIINNCTTDADVLNSTRTTKAVAAVTDVVVLNGATFTAAGTKSNKYTFRTIHVYGGGKLVVPASAADGFGIYSLVMRLGTVKDGTYTNSYPQLVMNGKYSNTSGIYLDYITTYERYYALSVPYPVKTKNIKYPADIYGDNLKSGNKASFALQYYDGAARATGATGWKDFDESGDEPTLTPYQGYTFWGAPRKVSVNGGDAQRPKFGIHRIPLTGAGADSLLTAETTAKTIGITAHPAERPNDMGWNFLGNPYLAQYGGLSAEDEDVQVGLLGHEMVDGKWTGGWKHTGNLRYVTTTTDGQNYTAVEVDKATFSPFNTFFIQAATDGALSFAWTSRAQSLPARQYAAQQEAAKEITTGILLTGNDQTDRTGLLIADNFTEEYDFNADLSKFENSGVNLYTIGKDGKLAYMAINQALAEQPIPVGYSAPAEGLYTIAFDEDRYNATDISALYLIDYDFNEKTNLLHADYSFVTAEGTNNQRFALQVAFAPENATNVEWVGDATIQVGVEGHELILNNLPTDAAVHVFDALGRLMYHTPHAPTEMQLTLPTGYYLVRIADKQHAAVINTVIP